MENLSLSHIVHGADVINKKLGFAQYAPFDNLSLFAEYIQERLGQSIVLIPNIGFATYCIDARTQSCYIVDIFVTKDARQKNYAKIMADEIVKEVKQKLHPGCKKLIGSVQTNTNGAHISEKVLKAYGFVFDYEDKTKNMKFFAKDI